MGSATVKMFVAVGEAVTQAAVLQKYVAKQLNCGVLITENVARQVYMYVWMCVEESLKYYVG